MTSLKPLRPNQGDRIVPDDTKVTNTARRAVEGLLSKVVSQRLAAAVQDNVAALLISSILVLAGVTVARFFREASLLAAFFLVGFIGLELTLLFLT